MSYIDFVSKIRTKFKNAILSIVEVNNINSIVSGDAEKDDTRIIFIPEKHKHSGFDVAMPLYLDNDFIVAKLDELRSENYNKLTYKKRLEIFANIAAW